MDVETKTAEVLEIRYVANFKELEEISHVDSLSFYNHCRREHLENILRNKRAFAVVAFEGNVLVGFVIYYAEKNNYIISRMAVHPNFRRKGYGKKILEKVCGKLSLLKKYVDITVKESNVVAQHFFKSMNFNAIRTIKENFITYHDDLPSCPYIEDGIVFRYDRK